jgi:hypothetical protein
VHPELSFGVADVGEVAEVLTGLDPPDDTSSPLLPAPVLMPELSTRVVLSGTPRRTSGKQYLVWPLELHISAMSRSLTVAKSTQLQPVGQDSPAAHVIPSGKQIFDAPSDGSCWQLHRAWVHWLLAVQACKDHVHVDGSVVQLGSDDTTPPSGNIAALCMHVVVPALHTSGAAQSES